MTPIQKPPFVRDTPTTTSANAIDIAGLVERRKQTVRALEQTKEVIQSGRLARSGETMAADLEAALAGKPEAGAPGTIRVRVAAAPVAKEKLPAVPLAELQVRLKIKEQIVREEPTNAVGLVELEVPAEFSKSDYEIEVFAPDCTVVACQHGRLTGKQTGPVHLIELPRKENLKPQIERAKPIEDGLKAARERAALVRTVAVKALKEQETRLVEYLAEIDQEIASTHAVCPSVPQIPVEVKAVQTQPVTTPRSRTLSADSTLKAKTKPAKAPSKSSKSNSKRRPSGRKKSK